MKIVILAIIVAFAYSTGQNLVGYVVTYTFTNGTTNALSTCTASVTVTFGAALATQQTYEVWGLYQASATSPGVNDVGIYCSVITSATAPYPVS